MDFAKLHLSQKADRRIVTCLDEVIELLVNITFTQAQAFERARNNHRLNVKSFFEMRNNGIFHEVLQLTRHAGQAYHHTAARCGRKVAGGCAHRIFKG